MGDHPLVRRGLNRGVINRLYSDGLWGLIAEAEGERRGKGEAIGTETGLVIGSRDDNADRGCGGGVQGERIGVCGGTLLIHARASSRL